VAKVEPLQLVKARPHDIIGVKPGEPLRIVSDDGRLVTVTVREGRGFEARDHGRPVAIVGPGTAIEDYSPGGDAMTGMRHAFSVGSSFALPGSDRRLRVVGLYAGAPTDKVFLPLGTAQELLNRRGKLSHLVITLQPGAAVDDVKSGVESSLGTAVEVVRR
jgi:hypothetical protein